MPLVVVGLIGAASSATTRSKKSGNLKLILGSKILTKDSINRFENLFMILP